MLSQIVKLAAAACTNGKLDLSSTRKDLADESNECTWTKICVGGTVNRPSIDLLQQRLRCRLDFDIDNVTLYWCEPNGGRRAKVIDAEDLSLYGIKYQTKRRDVCRSSSLRAQVAVVSIMSHTGHIEADGKQFKILPTAAETSEA